MGSCRELKIRFKAHLREEEERKERRRREEEAGGDDMEDEEAGSSEEVGVRVEVGKRKVARQGRSSESGVGLGGGGLDVEEEIRQLRCLSEEDRERCIGTFAVLSDEEVSSLSDEKSGGAALRVAPLSGDSVLTPCGCCSSLWGFCNFAS